MENIPQEVECLLCGSQAILTEKEFPGYKEPENYNIYNCNNCDTSFSMPQIHDLHEIYDLIYKNIKKIPNYYRYWHYAENVLIQNSPIDYLAEMEEAYWGIRDVLFNKLKISQNTRILEVGCGLGYLTYSLNKAGINTMGIDISAEAISYAKSKYGRWYECADIDEYVLNHTGEFDVIILTEVVEHVRETSLLKLGGIISMKVEFINFKNYYKKQTHSRLLSLRSLSSEKPTFDKSGKLKLILSDGLIEKNIGKSMFSLKKILGIRFYNFLRIFYYSFNKNYIVFGKHGFSLCAILYI